MDPFTNQDVFIETFKQRIETKYAMPYETSSIRQKYQVLGEMVQARIGENWLETRKKYLKHQPKQVHYFSMEFLMGRLITNNINNLGLRPVIEQGFKTLGLDLNAIEHYEADAGLGNGGLGRLAACFLDSIASLKLPGHGNGIRYRYGLFEQEIENGYQIEKPDDWLKDQYVWEVRADEDALDIPFGGYTSFVYGRADYRPDELIRAIPYDIPIVGDKNGVVNFLRLWNAEPTKVVPKDVNKLDYDSEIRRISGFLYPDDTTHEGKVLRIKQQYFFSAAGVRSLLYKHYATHKTFDNLSDLCVFQINDTHPSLIIPEMMRIMVDEYRIDWAKAWGITTQTCAYTNHTILAEALEKWPVDIFQPVLPRIYQIIEEINKRYCQMLIDTYANEQDKVRELAIIADGQIRMAHLAIVGAFSVNGVAALHTEIIKNIEMVEFNTLYPDKFNNKTNGITHRRWLEHINPELATILDTVTDTWRTDPDTLEAFKKYAQDQTVQAKVDAMKRKKKQVLADRIEAEQGIVLDVDGIFDIQVKRLHEYKRQLMNALHIMMLYNRLKRDPKFKEDFVPHSFIFGAKAASGYYYAKKIIKLITTIADKVNNDMETNTHIKVVFVENYNVTYAEQIMPACDLSEQISTASKEASGTGNMKFMMNGALTMGTLDGANVEIAERVGADHIFIFGLTSDEVNRMNREGGYHPHEMVKRDPDTAEVLEQLVNGFFETVEPDEFREIYDKLLGQDAYYVLKDLPGYRDAHERANAYYKNRAAWLESSIINIAMSGYFSSDRTIRQYAEEIWHIKPLD